MEKTFSKSETTNWSFKLYEIGEIVNHTIPSYRLNDLPERYNEASMKKTKVMSKKRCYGKTEYFHTIEIKISLAILAYTY